MNLTPKQLKILQLIRESRLTRGYSPTMQELADALREARGVEVQLSSIYRALIRAGYSYKKMLVAQERDRPDVRAARHLWTTQRQLRMLQPVAGKDCDRPVGRQAEIVK